MDTPALDRTGPTPLHAQIKTWIEGQITSGAWPPRFKLKAEVDLAQDLNVSRGTIRKAIADLIADGLLTQTHGRGTFVSPHVVEQPLADRLVTFSEDLISKGIPFETRVIEQAVTPAQGRIAAMLRIAPGAEVFYLRRVRLVEGEPLILLNNYVVYARCPGIEKFDFTTARLFQVLEDHYHLSLENGRRTFQAIAANHDVAQRLAMAQGDPVMHVEQQALLEDNTVIECSDIWLSGDRFRLVAAVSRPGRAAIGMTVAVVPNDASPPD